MLTTTDRAAADDQPATAFEPIPLVDLKAQYATLRDEMAEAIQRVLDSAGFILGAEVRAFEEAFAEWCGVGHAVGVSSGTAALELALRALEVGPGDEVITVAHTFIATAEAISAVGARPIFVEVEAASANMDADAFAAAITPRTRAVLPVHLYGRPADMARISAVAHAAELPIVADAAQAHGATLRGEGLGALGDVVCFSFYPGKNLGAYGDAGAITTNDARLAERIRLLRNHGRHDKYVHEMVGSGERLDALQAAVLRAKLPHLTGWVQARRRVAARYSALLAGSRLELPQPAAGFNPAWHLYVVRTASYAEREGLLAFLRRHGVEAGVHYPLPLHLQPAYRSLGYARGDLPITEAWAATCLSLPIYPELTEAQQDRVVDLIQRYMGGGG